MEENKITITKARSKFASRFCTCSPEDSSFEAVFTDMELTSDYGEIGLPSAVKIGSRTLASYSYEDSTNYPASLDYGNGDGVDCTYDKIDR